MKVHGTIQGQYLTILLDSGSTHNFMDSRLLKRYGWFCSPTQQFEVMIADGGRVTSPSCCRGIPLFLGDYHCLVDLFALPLGGVTLCWGFNGYPL